MMTAVSRETARVEASASGCFYRFIYLRHFYSLVYTPPSNFLRLWYLVIARTPRLVLALQFVSLSANS
jgi:hypothetical protein